MVEVPDREALHEGKFRFEEELEQEMENRRNAEAPLTPLPVVTNTTVDDVRIAPIRAGASPRPVRAYGAPVATVNYGTVVGPYSDVATRLRVNYPRPSDLQRGTYSRGQE